MKAFKHPSDSAAHEIYLKYSKYGKYIYIYGRKITLFVVGLGERSSVIVAELEERH